MFSIVAVGGVRSHDLTLMARKPGVGTLGGKLTEDFSFVFFYLFFFHFLRFRRVYMHPPYWSSHILKSL